MTGWSKRLLTEDPPSGPPDELETIGEVVRTGVEPHEHARGFPLEPGTTTKTCMRGECGVVLTMEH